MIAFYHSQSGFFRFISILAIVPETITYNCKISYGINRCPDPLLDFSK